VIAHRTPAAVAGLPHIPHKLPIYKGPVLAAISADDVRPCLIRLRNGSKRKTVLIAGAGEIRFTNPPTHQGWSAVRRNRERAAPGRLLPCDPAI
jgi:hypothetical protein